MTVIMNTSVTLSDNAAKRISFLRTKRGNDALKLRLTVLSGGCSGLQYQFSFDDAIKEGDSVVENQHVTMLIDTVSLDFLKGAVVDYVEDLAGASFQVKNPNAAASCGCGNSFTPK
jgi:iron-sulfur cluster insertion protein